MSLQTQNKTEPGKDSISHRRFEMALRALLVMIVTLMALGAGVRTMNAGLSCPDWPLCFGKVIPDFHPAVWFEFVHRAYAGLVAIVFFGCFVYAFRNKASSRTVRVAAGFGLAFLVLQIVMGGLTVLLLVKEIVVTSHLMLATFFFCSVLMMLFAVAPKVTMPTVRAPAWVSAMAALIPVFILVQIFLGGLVASTYAGSVCVDWPLCNGQWVPTWQGAIGLQIIHRFVAYFITAFVIGYGALLHVNRHQSWMTPQLKWLILGAQGIVVLQVALGIANLLFFIPPALAVAHQTGAIVLLAVSARLAYVTRAISSKSWVSENQAVDQVPHSAQVQV